MNRRSKFSISNKLIKQFLNFFVLILFNILENYKFQVQNINFLRILNYTHFKVLD